MLSRIGLLGRIMLILMAALGAVIVGAILVGRMEPASPRSAQVAPYPRLEQAAGVIDLLSRTDPSLRPTILRAVSGIRLHAALADAAPPGEGLRRLPRSEAMLRAFSEALQRPAPARTTGFAPMPTARAGA